MMVVPAGTEVASGAKDAWLDALPAVAVPPQAVRSPTAGIARSAPSARRRVKALLEDCWGGEDAAVDMLCLSKGRSVGIRARRSAGGPG